MLEADKIKVFAQFLPQFHRIPENDRWWGEGFTEWNNVKKAAPLYKNHRQPQVPLDGYYDLAETSTLKRQAQLLQEYDISGFCFYHYYSAGKLLLEKPSEILLNAKEIDIEFFFSWANHDWRRTWYAFNNEMLFEQKYGDEEEIKQHYNYLNKFFLDNRYLKLHNKPVFVIYRTDLIPYFSKLKGLWNQCAKENGFDGVFFVSTVTGLGVDKKAVEYDAFFSFEPDSIIAEQQQPIVKIYQSLRAKIVARLNKVLPNKIFKQIFDYPTLIADSENRKIDFQGKFFIQGAFARWDNTPRHSYNGRIIKNNNVALFKDALAKKINNQDPNALPLIIINSWNEWSEGSNIEPNTEDKYAYLEAIKETLNA